MIITSRNRNQQVHKLTLEVKYILWWISCISGGGTGVPVFLVKILPYGQQLDTLGVAGSHYLSTSHCF